jgi:hypothetical protein
MYRADTEKAIAEMTSRHLTFTADDIVKVVNGYHKSKLPYAEGLVRVEVYRLFSVGSVCFESYARSLWYRNIGTVYFPLPEKVINTLLCIRDGRGDY